MLHIRCGSRRENLFKKKRLNIFTGRHRGSNCETGRHELVEADPASNNGKQIDQANRQTN
jgi:hypothetical protein